MNKKEKLENYTQKPNMFSESRNDVRLISEEIESTLDNQYKMAMSIMDSNMEIIDDENRKDELYQEVINAYNDMRNVLLTAKYNFSLTSNEVEYINSILRNETKYDVNTIFVGINLVKLLDAWLDTKGKSKDELLYEATQTDITLIYHLIAEHKIKGINKHAYLFASILTKIGEISKIINYYDNLNKNINQFAIKKWLPTIENMTAEQAKEMENELLLS